MLKEIFKCTFDIFIISGCRYKLNGTFSNKQFHIDNFRKDRNKNCGSRILCQSGFEL